MDRSIAQNITCSHCGEEFATKGKYIYHYRKVHRNDIQTSHLQGTDSVVHRSDNEKFTCLCTKEYLTYESLYRHQKTCQQWNEHQTAVESSTDSSDSEQGIFVSTETDIVEDIVGNDDEEIEQGTTVLPLAWNETYNIAICTGCRIGIPFDWIITHLKDNHGLRCNENKVLEFLNITEPTMKVDEAKHWLKQHRSLEQPIAIIPVDNGFGCSLCPCSTKKKKAIYNHILNSHQGSIIPETMVERKVQRIFTGSLKQYVYINLVDNENEEAIPDWRATLTANFNQTLKKLTQSKDPGSTDLRLVNAFIAKTR